jgi:hypothetical protein
MAIAPRRVRGFCLACLQSLLPRRHPRGGLVDLPGGVDQIHQRPGLERRQGAGSARGEDRARGLGKIAGALDLRQIKHDEAIPMPDRISVESGAAYHIQNRRQQKL